MDKGCFLLKMVIRRFWVPWGEKGFTLLELLMAMFVSIIVLGAVYATYAVEQRSYVKQRLIADVQQNVRGSLLILQRHVRLAGTANANNGIASIAMLDISGNPDVNGFPSISLQGDFDLDGAADTAVFRIYDFMNDGTNDLGLNFNGGGTQLLAEGIQAIGLAYAIDANGDGVMDTTPVNNNLIWAVDSNNDGMLDTNLDANDDGTIDINDDQDGDGILGTPLGTLVPTSAIRMVQIWVLGVSQRQETKGTLDTGFYVVGHRVWPLPTTNPNGFQDRFRRRLLSSVVFCRNL